MRRWSTFVLVFFTVAAFATILVDTASMENVPSPPTDGTLYSQPYNFANIRDAFYIQGNNIGADDFIIATDANVNQVELWLIYFGATHPVDLDIVVYDDIGDTHPGSVFWTGTVPAAQITEVDTGDDISGHDIYNVTVDLGDGFSVSAGDKYWLGVHATGTDYVAWVVADQLWADLCCWSIDNGYTWVNVGTIECFFNLYGETGLTQETWGNIKTEFQE